MMTAAFVLAERLPATVNAKLDIAALPYRRPEREISDVPDIEPPDSAEVALASMWRNLLRAGANRYK
jgi:hypothetical protein